MASFKDFQEFAPDDILCDPKSHRAGRGGNVNLIIGYHKVLQKVVAVKIYGATDVLQDESLIVQSVKDEIKHMQIASHENVVKVFGFVKWLFHFGIVMEYCKGGDLRTLLFTPNVEMETGVIVRILAEIAKGLAFLHSLPGQHLVHGNIKPENILLTKNLHSKLCDFGNAELVSPTEVFLRGKTLKPNFTPIYTAPEKLIDEQMTPTKELDVYAFAISTYVVLSRQLPFLREHWSKTTSSIIEGKRPDCGKIFERMQNLSNEDRKTIETIKELMIKCWDQDPRKRLSMTEVANKLQYLLHQQDTTALHQQVKNVARAFDFEKYDFFIQGQLFTLNLFTFSTQAYFIEQSPPDFHHGKYTSKNIRSMQKVFDKCFEVSDSSMSLKKTDKPDILADTETITDSIEICDDLCITAKVGEGGGTFEVGGCKVIIPPNALQKDVEIEITCDHDAKIDNVKRLTPLLRCKPHGLTFGSKIEIFLPTIYRAEKDSLTVAVRRARDEFSAFETIRKDLLRNKTESFKFFTDQFSLFDVILFRFKQKVKLLREKVLILGVSPDQADAPVKIVCSVLVCHNKDPAKSLNNMNKIMETNFLLKYEDRELDVQLTGEHLNVVTAEIKDAQCARDETRFTLQKNNGEGWISDVVEICVTSKSQETLVKKNVPITKEDRAHRALPGVQSNFTGCTLQSPTIAASLSHHDGRNT